MSCYISAIFLFLAVFVGASIAQGESYYKEARSFLCSEENTEIFYAETMKRVKEIEECLAKESYKECKC